MEVLNAIYEADFRGLAYGLRPGRSPHDALDALTVGLARKKVNWVLDADIGDFFGQLDQAWLRKFIPAPNRGPADLAADRQMVGRRGPCRTGYGL